MKYNVTPEQCNQHSNIGPDDPFDYNGMTEEDGKYYWTVICLNCGAIRKHLSTKERYIGELVHDNELLKYRDNEKYERIINFEAQVARLHEITRAIYLAIPDSAFENDWDESLQDLFLALTDDTYQVCSSCGDYRLLKGSKCKHCNNEDVLDSQLDKIIEGS